MFEPNTTLIDGLLDELFKANGTDLHLSVGTPPRMRVDGNLMDVPGAQSLDEDAATAMIDALMDDPDVAKYHADRQLDFAFSWREHSRFRANAFFQKGSPALALRLIPAPRTPGATRSMCPAGRPSTRFGIGHRPNRIGQVDIVGVDGEPHFEDQAMPHPDD